MTTSMSSESGISAPGVVEGCREPAPKRLSCPVNHGLGEGKRLNSDSLSIHVRRAKIQISEFAGERADSHCTHLYRGTAMVGGIKQCPEIGTFAGKQIEELLREIMRMDVDGAVVEHVLFDFVKERSPGRIKELTIWFY